MLGFTFGQLLIGSKPLTAQNDCKLVFESMTKLFDPPTHAYVTMNIGGKPKSESQSNAGGLIYAKYDGKWSAGTATKEMKEIAEKNRHQTCTARIEGPPVLPSMTLTFRTASTLRLAKSVPAWSRSSCM